MAAEARVELAELGADVEELRVTLDGVLQGVDGLRVATELRVGEAELAPRGGGVRREQDAALEQRDRFVEALRRAVRHREAQDDLRVVGLEAGERFEGGDRLVVALEGHEHGGELAVAVGALRIDADERAQRRQRIAGAVEGEARDAEAVEGRRILRLLLEDLLVGRGRFLVQLELGRELRAERVHADVVRRHLHGAADGVEGLLRAPERLLVVRELEERLVAVGVRLLERHQGRSGAALVPQLAVEDRQLAVGLHELRVVLERALEARDGLGIAPQFGQDRAEIEVRTSVVALQAKDVLQGRDRVLEAPEIVLADRELVVRLGIRADVRGLRVRHAGLAQLAHPLIRAPELHVRLGVIRIELRDGAEGGDRLAAAAQEDVRERGAVERGDVRLFAAEHVLEGGRGLRVHAELAVDRRERAVGGDVIGRELHGLVQGLERAARVLQLAAALGEVDEHLGVLRAQAKERLARGDRLLVLPRVLVEPREAALRVEDRRIARYDGLEGRDRLGDLTELVVGDAELEARLHVVG
jgi:hypothetical protein